MNENKGGELKKTTLRLGNDHELNIAIIGGDQIKCIVKEIEN